MCGICGVVNVSEEPVPTELLQAMARTLRHRGPDEEGYYSRSGVGFGFQRLSIIDLEGGHQPMGSQDGSLCLVFNGEIYNYQILRKELEATGRHRFRTQSDTEVILHLYQEYGKECVQYMRGMFAFALWDAPQQTLLLARDRFGKKPLVYAEGPGSLLFASEAKALLKHPLIHKTIHYPAIDLYLSYQYIPSPHTIFQQIKKLPPAHRALWKGGRLTLERYWEPRFLPKTTFRFEEAMERMWATLREATRLRMIADVPLGAFLSGGIDSSIVVGLMSELSRAPVKTFSIGFEEETLSELPYARRVAKHFHCDHHEMVVKPDAVEILPKLAWHYGEPFADSSALPSYYVSKATRQHVTVALNGDGGDESFAGYPRYQAMMFMKVLGTLPHPVRSLLHKLADVFPDGTPPVSWSWRLKRLLRLGLADPRAVYTDALSFFRQEEKAPLYSDFMREQVKNQFAPDYVGEILAQVKHYPAVDAFLYTDLRTYLPEGLLVKMDIASMAHSLETRSPFLDHELVNLVAEFPPQWKLHGLRDSKYMLRRAARGWLPKEILRRRKQGFAVPMSRWFRGPLKSYLASMLLSEKALARGLFRQAAIERLVQENSSGKRDHSYGLWALLMLEQWFQVYIDSDA